MNKIIVIATLLLTASASAQLEEITGVISPSISLSMDAEGTIQTDAPTSFMLTVTNNAAATGTPLDLPTEIKLELDSAPTSWVVEISPAILEVMPGQSATSTVTISSAPGSAAAGAVTIRGFANNGIGPLTTEGADSATIELTNVDNATTDLLNTLGPWVWVLLALLILTIILVIVMWAQSNKKIVKLSTDNPTIKGTPGGKLTVPITVRNLTNKHSNILFDVSESSGQWAAFMLSPELELRSHAVGEAQFVAIIPQQNPGEKAVYTITAQSSAGPKQTASLKITVLVE